MGKGNATVAENVAGALVLLLDRLGHGRRPLDLLFNVVTFQARDSFGLMLLRRVRVPHHHLDFGMPHHRRQRNHASAQTARP